LKKSLQVQIFILVFLLLFPRNWRLTAYDAQHRMVAWADDKEAKNSHKLERFIAAVDAAGYSLTQQQVTDIMRELGIGYWPAWYDCHVAEAWVWQIVVFGVKRYLEAHGVPVDLIPEGLINSFGPMH
jgi:hypothetical protein